MCEQVFWSDALPEDWCLQKIRNSSVAFKVNASKNSEGNLHKQQE
jgi:hypothetical protein